MANKVEAVLTLDDRMSKQVGSTEKKVKQFGSSGERAMNRIKTSAGHATRVVKTLGGAARSALGTVAKWGTRAGLAFGAFTAASIKFASDVQESEGLFEVSMGNMADSTRAWSEALADSLKLNASTIRRDVSTLNVMMTSMGLGEKQAQEYSQALTELAYDIGSFYNISNDEAFLKLRSGIVGETVPLKQLGIVINETVIKQTALKHGLAEVGQELDEQTKVQARYIAILERTQAAQGDLNRTSASFANVWQSIKALVVDNMEAFGEGLIPVVTSGFQRVQTWLYENKDSFKEWGERAGKAVEAFGEKAIPVLENVFNFLTSDISLDEKLAKSLRFGSEALALIAETTIPMAWEIGVRIGREIKDGLISGLTDKESMKAHLTAYDAVKLSGGKTMGNQLTNPYWHYVKNDPSLQWQGDYKAVRVPVAGGYDRTHYIHKDSLNDYYDYRSQSESQIRKDKQANNTVEDEMFNRRMADLKAEMQRKFEEFYNEKMGGSQSGGPIKVEISAKEDLKKFFDFRFYASQGAAVSGVNR